MNEWGWLLAGGAAITGAITMFWSYVRSFWSQIASHIIVNCKVQGGLEQAVSMYSMVCVTISDGRCLSDLSSESS